MTSFAERHARRMARVDALLAMSERLGASSRMYGRWLDRVRGVDAERHARLAARFKRESTRLCAQADALIG